MEAYSMNFSEMLRGLLKANDNVVFIFFKHVGHTSVQMCKRLMGNLNLLRSVRSIYSQPNSFNYHQTTKHKTQSALPDVIKGMWFCIRNKLLQDQLVSQGSIPLELPLRRTNEVPKKVRKCFIEVISKGEKKVKDKLKEKLHESFPLFRLTSLESVLEQEEDMEELSDGL